MTSRAPLPTAAKQFVAARSAVHAALAAGLCRRSARAGSVRMAGECWPAPRGRMGRSPPSRRHLARRRPRRPRPSGRRGKPVEALMTEPAFEPGDWFEQPWPPHGDSRGSGLAAGSVILFVLLFCGPHAAARRQGSDGAPRSLDPTTRRPICRRRASKLKGEQRRQFRRRGRSIAISRHSPIPSLATVAIDVFGALRLLLPSRFPGS